MESVNVITIILIAEESPVIALGYKYNFGPTDCYVRPYIILTDPSNPNCGKCECNNYNSDCGGKPCDCAII